MKFKIRDYLDEPGTDAHWVSSFILTLLGRDKELCNEIVANDSVCDVVVTINGKEMNPLNFIKHLQTCFEEEVKKAAASRVEEGLQNIQ